MDVLVVHCEDENAKSIKELGVEFPVLYELNATPRSRKGFFGKLRSLLDPSAPYPHGLGVDRAANARITETVATYDLIWLFKLRTANMFASARWPRSVLDIDDLPSAFHTTAAQSADNQRERLAARLEALRWRRRQGLLDKRFDVLAVCSQMDRKALSNQSPVHVIPNGFEAQQVDPKLARRPLSPRRIGFIGLFDYFANAEGVRWFITTCWPRIKAEMPDVRLRLVGRGSDGPMKTLGLDIDGLGWVDNTSDEIATWSLMIIPLHKGGGTRVKIAEGFSRKCPIVSTTIGAYGYEVEDGRQLRLADTSESFAEACLGLLRNPREAAEMAERASVDFMQKWTWAAIAPKVWAAAEDCLRRQLPQQI